MLKFAVGFTHIVTLVLGLMGVLPFACWTSAIVAYGMAGEMVKLAETNSMSEWGCGLCAVAGWPAGRPAETRLPSHACPEPCAPPFPAAPS